jgi:hypothetical protein
MPAKSRRKKGKFSPQRKQQVTAASQQSPRPVQQAVVSKQPTSRPITSTPQAAAPAAKSFSYSNVPTELKTIGIIGGILLIALIVIAILI